MSAQASGKAVEHEWLMRENSNGHLRGKCSCGEPAMGLMTRDAWYAHLSYLRAEQAANPVASSAHFPRITKHDLEVVVEAMDKLRQALRVEEAAKPWQCFTEHPIRKTMNAAAPPSVDGLEAQDNLKRRILVHLQNALFIPDKEEKQIVDEMEYFIRTRDREREREIRELRGWKESAMELFKAFDSQAVGKALGLQLGESVMDKVLPAILAMQAADRELVEKLEGLAAKWEKENSLRSDDSYRYPQQLRAVLAARNEGGK